MPDQRHFVLRFTLNFSWIAASLVFATFAWSSDAIAARIEPIQFAYKIRNQTVVSNGVFYRQAPRYSDLEAAGQTWTSPSDLLKAILKRSPELSNQFILVHSSESQQPSSLQFPRVILFGGGMSYSFSEHPGQKNQRVEIMEVDPKTQAVSFHEIVFEDQKARFVSNPASCAACHGTPARPLWNPYDFWPNAFGSFAGMATTKNEVDAYAEVRAKAAKSPILSKLEMPRRLEVGDDRISAFSQYVTQIHFARWVADEIGTRSLGGYEKPLLAVLGQCLPRNAGVGKVPGIRELRAYFAEGELSEDAVARYEEIVADSRADRLGFNNFLIDFERRIYPSPLKTVFKVDHQRLAAEAEIAAQLRWVLDLAGIDASALSMSLTANDSINSTPLNFSFDLLTTLLAQRPDLFADVAWRSMDLGTGQSSFIELDCEKLRRSSRSSARSAAAAPSWQTRLTVKPGRSVISRCAKCHVESVIANGAPRLPFTDPLAMGTAIRESGLDQRILSRVRDRGGPTQMPPGQPLTDSEIESLSEYLKAVQ